MSVCYNVRMSGSHKFGHRPPEIPRQVLGMGWISGVRRLEFSSAKASYWHRHEETALLGCLKGEMTYEFHGIPPITLSAGSFLVIPAQVEHRHLGEVDPVGQRVELLLDVSPRSQSKYALFTPAAARTLHAALLRKALTPAKCTKDVQTAFAELYDFAKKPCENLPEPDLGYIRLLVTRILFGVALPRKTHAEQPPVMMSTVLNWIEAHYNEPIDIDRLVAKVGFSRTHVFNLFKKQTGLTPADYIVRFRIRKACEALEDPELTSKEIARACGFQTPSNFNAVFKRQIGLTPSQWRQRRKVRETPCESPWTPRGR